MELELKQRELAGYDILLETTLFSEESTEWIVPDFCPDILRIVECSASVCITDRACETGRAEVRGKMQVSLLYLPDGAQGLRHMEVLLPFSCRTEREDLREDCPVHAAVGSVRMQARMLNPRKVSLRGETAVDLWVYAPVVLRLTEGCMTGEHWGVEEKKEVIRFSNLCALQEKQFTYSDTVVLPAGKPDAEELLRYGVEPVCGEVRIIGSKLVLKGQAVLRVLYRTAEGELITASFELPFSQILDAPGTDGEAGCEMRLLITDLSCRSIEEEPRRFAVELGLLAQAEICREEEAEILTDFYSTVCASEVDPIETAFRRTEEARKCRAAVREVLETPVPVRSVADCTLRIGEPVFRQEEGVPRLCAEVEVCLLYLGEEGEVYHLERTLTGECRPETEQGSRCVSRCRCPGELYATPTTGGIEVRFPLDFSYYNRKECLLKQVSGGRLDENAPRETANRPSVILRRAERGESLWDLAKSCATTRKDILAANELSQESLPEGRMLLIPKKR